MRKLLAFFSALFLACASGSDDSSAKTHQPAGSVDVLAGDSVAPECTQDSDCVPATCCHATWCTQASKAPACEEVGCQAVHVEQSLDGISNVKGGGCLCVEGRCGARLNDGCVVVGPQPEAQIRSDDDPPLACPPR